MARILMARLNITLLKPWATAMGPVSRIVNYESFLIYDFLNLGTFSRRSEIFFLSFSNPFSTFWSPGNLSCQVGRICIPCIPLLPQLLASLPVHHHCADLTTSGFCTFAHIPSTWSCDRSCPLPSCIEVSTCLYWPAVGRLVVCSQSSHVQSILLASLAILDSLVRNCGSRSSS